MSDIRIYPYAPLRAITTWATVLIVAKLLALGLYDGVGVYAVVLGRPVADISEFTAGSIVTVIYGLISVVSGIVSLVWIYHAARNTRALSLPTMKPPWVVGSFFVPVVNLYRPFLFMRDIWMAAQDPYAGNSRGDWLLAIWWFCNLVGDYMILAGRDAPTDTSVFLTGKGNVLTWIGTLVFLYLVRRISYLQNRLDHGSLEHR
ncbi:MAG: DUF4328 domain-containing protein [Asticcacaulis sp.]|nr:DUF4328 domain-containing protein [Asticcacaulis sp.]